MVQHNQAGDRIEAALCRQNGNVPSRIFEADIGSVERNRFFISL
jgi:hypothetical protein